MMSRHHKMTRHEPPKPRNRAVAFAILVLLLLFGIVFWLCEPPAAKPVPALPPAPEQPAPVPEAPPPRPGPRRPYASAVRRAPDRRTDRDSLAPATARAAGHRRATAVR